VALAPGTRLGAYEILSLIGSGGMGEVYRATDTKLHRDVAIKVLPSDVAADHDRLARFEREAQVLASLNHPNIAHIHGIEDSSGTPALVMELVEGPTLADRIAKGPIPLDEALPIAKQIAEALEAAHEQGIIHRDLKPANIKVRPDGTVKVLDFGLAKAFDPVASTVGNATMSPTLSIHATQAGLIIGTPAYMAPELARGKAVERRADIWAFGCVLFEMLTGRRAFDGDDISTTLAAVIRADPEWAALASATPIGLRQLLRQCLQKDPRRRLQAIGDARVQIDDLLAGASENIVTPSDVRVTAGWRHVVIPVTMLLLGSVVTLGVMWFATRSTVARPRVSRLLITPSSAAASFYGSSSSHDVALAPDGSRLIYVGANGTTLFVRPLDQLDATPLVHGDALRDPFISPDGEWVGFFEGPITLKKVPMTGGPAVLVAQINGAERGATWAADGQIIFATSTVPTGLQRVSTDGGTPAVLTRPDRARGEANHWWPEMLPGGHAVLYTITATSGPDANSIAVLDLRNGRSSIVLRGGSHAQYVPSGHLVYAAVGTLRAVGFDLKRLSVVGAARPMVPQVLTAPLGAFEAVLSPDGTLVYVTQGSRSVASRTLVWVDRQGRETPIAAPPRVYGYPRVSPDGTRIAVTSIDQNPDIWLWDLARQTLTRVTSDPAVDGFPAWMPDGRRIVFGSDRAGALNLFSQAADGTGGVDRLTESPNGQVPSAVTPDGRRLVFTDRSSTTGYDVMAVALDGKHQVTPLAQTPFDESNGIVSPDGRWLAYEANDTGSFEIYVRSFPDVNGGRWQVSTTGGTQPLWARSGQDLFYLRPDGALMRAAVKSGPAWTASVPTKMFDGPYALRTGGYPARNYDIAPDDQRFLMMKPTGGDATGTTPQIVVVQHFDEELRRLIPTK
jgi:serine/threonine-protein kinase